MVGSREPNLKILLRVKWRVDWPSAYHDDIDSYPVSAKHLKKLPLRENRREKRERESKHRAKILPKDPSWLEESSTDFLRTYLTTVSTPHDYHLSVIAPVQQRQIKIPLHKEDPPVLLALMSHSTVQNSTHAVLLLHARPSSIGLCRIWTWIDLSWQTITDTGQKYPSPQFKLFPAHTLPAHGFIDRVHYPKTGRNHRERPADWSINQSIDSLFVCYCQ